MTKICIVTDTHFGVRNDDVRFGRYIADFFTKVFFPYIDKHNIKHVLHCGDVVDRRKYINFLTARTLHNAFISQLERRTDVEAMILIGNHDVFFKNNNSVNSIRELYGDRMPKNIRFVENIAPAVEFAGTTMDLYGWINTENQDSAYDLMDNPQSKIAFGHFEFSGFEMQKGQIMEHGMNHAALKKYEFVGSGHYHEKSNKDNVHYFGCPYELTWADYECLRGFHIFDTETLELIHIINPLTMFKRVVYNDDQFTLEQMQTSIDPDKIRDSIVRLVVETKGNVDHFNLFRKFIEDCGPQTVKIVEDTKFFELEEVDVDGHEDTLSMLMKYVEVTEIEDKSSLSLLMTELYNEALTEQVVE